MESQRVGHNWATELNWITFSNHRKIPAIKFSYGKGIMFRNDKVNVLSSAKINHHTILAVILIISLIKSIHIWQEWYHFWYIKSEHLPLLVVGDAGGICTAVPQCKMIMCINLKKNNNNKILFDTASSLLGIQLTLQQHRLQQHRSTYTWIFFLE